MFVQQSAFSYGNRRVRLPTDDSNSGGSLIVYSRDTLSGNTLADAQTHTRVRIQYIHLGCAYAASKCKSIAML